MDSMLSSCLERTHSLKRLITVLGIISLLLPLARPAAQTSTTVTLHGSSSDVTVEDFEKTTVYSLATAKGEQYTCGRMKPSSSPSSHNSTVKSFKISSECVAIKKGFWDYKVCPFRSVEQMHMNSQNVASIKFNLGTFVSSSDVVDADDGSITQIHVFEGGTADRKTHVHFFCDAAAGKKNKRAILSVTEHIKHEYEIKVHVPSLCDKKSQPSPKAKMLAAFRKADGQCVSKVVGWWTYEFCFGGKIRQYHLDEKKKISSEFILGVFDTMNPTSTKKSLDDDDDDTDNTNNEDDDGDFYGEMFTRGTPCELKGSPRSTEVRYYCNSASSAKTTTSSMHEILGIEETSTCAYTMKVSTSLVCEYLAKQGQDKIVDVGVHCIAAA